MARDSLDEVDIYRLPYARQLLNPVGACEEVQSSLIGICLVDYRDLVTNSRSGDDLRYIRGVACEKQEPERGEACMSLQDHASLSNISTIDCMW